jgi:hypothetical protein
MADPGVIIPEVAPQAGNDDITAMEEEDDDNDEAVIKKEIDEDVINSLPPMVSITRVPKVKPEASAAPLLKIRSDLGAGGMGTTPPSSRGTPPPLLRVGNGGLPARPSLPPMPRLRLGAVRGTGPTAAAARGGIPAGYPLNGMMNHHHMMPYSAESLMSMSQYQRPVMSQSMMHPNAQQLGLPVIAGTMSLSRGAAIQQQQQLRQEQLLIKQQQQRQLANQQQQQRQLAAMQQQQRATGMVRQRTTFSPAMLPTANRPVQVHLVYQL